MGLASALRHFVTLTTIAVLLFSLDKFRKRFHSKEETKRQTTVVTYFVLSVVIQTTVVTYFVLSVVII
jgi:hypothetical protein